MKTAQPHLDLQPHMIYRIAYNAQNAALAGNLIVFLAYADVFGARRASVRILGTEETYLLQPGCIIGF